MLLKDLIFGIHGIDAIYGSLEQSIKGITASSKEVQKGCLFIARKGSAFQGSAFIAEAIERGASAIVCEDFQPTLPATVAQLITKDVTILQGALACRFFHRDQPHLPTVGVTGTSGKTTTTYIIRHMLQELKKSTIGLIGTIEWVIGNDAFPSMMTTPDIFTVHSLLSKMKSKGSCAAVMEVSSHALTQGRVKGVNFDVALFTNLSQDHLDYHKSMEEYAAAKALLFSSLSSTAYAVVNGDCPYSKVMLAECRGQVLTYGINGESTVVAKDVVLSPADIQATIVFGSAKANLRSPMIGQFNLYNLLGAITAAIALGYSLQEAVKAVSSFQAVPGRLEKIATPSDIAIFVDYAHKPDALSNVLKTLRPLTQNRLLCLFGCGGDRDKGKRAIMGKIASTLADIVIITSDNPRSEDPLAIIDDIIKGIDLRANLIIEPDRRKAIAIAKQSMEAGDLLLIAGKGHENYQIFADQVLAFDDRSEVRALFPCS